MDNKLELLFQSLNAYREFSLEKWQALNTQNDPNYDELSQMLNKTLELELINALLEKFTLNDSQLLFWMECSKQAFLDQNTSILIITYLYLLNDIPFRIEEFLNEDICINNNLEYYIIQKISCIREEFIPPHLEKQKQEWIKVLKLNQCFSIREKLEKNIFDKLCLGEPINFIYKALIPMKAGKNNDY